jgi:hypothetical protein
MVPATHAMVVLAGGDWIDAGQPHRVKSMLSSMPGKARSPDLEIRRYRRLRTSGN